MPIAPLPQSAPLSVISAFISMQRVHPIPRLSRMLVVGRKLTGKRQVAEERAPARVFRLKRVSEITQPGVDAFSQLL